MTQPSPTVPVDREQFERWVHEALARLYDTPYLQSHPLADLLPPATAVSALHRCQALRRALLEAIQALRPGPGTPAQSPDWRAYRILELRYIEGMNPNEAMQALALGRSQFFREQARAVELVTATLWDRYLLQLDPKITSPKQDAGEETLLRSEAERLSSHASWQPLEVTALLQELRPVVEPLAQQKGAALTLTSTGCLREVRGDRVMLRQVLLGLLTLALEAIDGGEVELSDFLEGGRQGLRLRARSHDRHAAWPAAGCQDLEICRHLVETLGANLHQESHEMGLWLAEIAWPVGPPHTLLVVDDNQGLIDLFTRYLAGHGWQVVGANSCAEARRLLSELRPSAIALDVMMPEEDGWEMLLSLKRSPATRQVPVIVCSVLRQPQLAQSLGAAAYLPKPVTQQALLEVLARWSAGRPIPGPGS